MNQEEQELWARVLGDLAHKVRPELVGDWLAGLELSGCRPEAVTVTAPSRLHAKLVEDHYGELLADGFERVTGSRPRVRVDARPSAAEAPPRGTPRRGALLPLNPSFTLETFVAGSPSRLALAACRAVVDRPGELYNPLFIYGPSGTGKTHLLQAVCRELGPQHRVIYLTADEFSARVAASREEAEAFRDELRSAGVLALDDIQALEGREASQEEFFHAFNSLYNSNCQLLLAADAPPRSLAVLPARLTSRFTWGLTAEIEPPLFENRLEILTAKAAARSLDAAPEILEELASAKTTNVRELEGLLARLAAGAELEGKLPTRQTARELAALPTAASETGNAPSSERIQRIVAAAYGLRPNDILGPSRTRSVALARHVAIYLARQLTDLPVQEIGGHFGGRDHSTVNYAIRKISRLIEEDKALAKTVHRLNRQLSGVKRVSG